MIKRVIIYLCLFLNSSIVICQVSNYEFGDIVDDFTVTDVNGDSWNLYNLTSQGKYVYIDFFFDTCPPCQLTQAAFNEFYDKYGCNEGDVIMLSINNGTDTNAEVIAYEDEFGGPFNHAPAVGIEGNCTEVVTNFGVIGYPCYIIINPENKFIHYVDESIVNIDVEAFENGFPLDFNPEVAKCSLGINESFNNSNFSIFPNPSNGNNISIILNEENNDGSLKIFNMNGLKVYETDILENKFSLSTKLDSGNYIVEIITNKNKRLIKKLIIK